MVVVNEYSKAFGNAGAGKYGAVRKAGVAEAGGQAAAFNPATVSFDTYCEIMGAQAAWSAQGKDVSAMLKQVFNMTALDYSNVAQYWSPKMMTDMSLAMKMSDLMMRSRSSSRCSRMDMRSMPSSSLWASCSGGNSSAAMF